MNNTPTTTPPPSRADLLERLRSEVASRASELDGEPRVFFAPGRVNLLGAHLDYNGGFVLPVAIDHGTYVAVSPRRDGRLSLRSLDLDGEVDCPLDALPRGADLEGKAWTRYPMGVLRIFHEEFAPLEGLDLCFGGDLPRGSGLSSSASIEIVTAYAIIHQLELDIDTGTMASIAHRAENDFVGVQCGIMDQFAAAHGKEGRALFLNCRTNEFEYLPLPTDSVSIVVTDTLRRRRLADGQLNERVRECREALEICRADHPDLEVLGDLDRADLERKRSMLGPSLYARARHVIEECARCHTGADALRRGDLRSLGRQLEASHASTRDHYGVSCDELDFVVETASDFEGTFGSRLTGAGFGGCTVSLVRPGAEAGFAHHVSRPFAERFGQPPRLFVFHAGGGPREVRTA